MNEHENCEERIAQLKAEVSMLRYQLRAADDRVDVKLVPLERENAELRAQLAEAHTEIGEINSDMDALRYIQLSRPQAWVRVTPETKFSPDEVYDVYWAKQKTVIRVELGRDPDYYHETFEGQGYSLVRNDITHYRLANIPPPPAEGEEAKEASDE